MSGWDQGEQKAGDKGGDKEWKLIEKLLLSTQNEQKKARRWGIFFKALLFVYLFGILLLTFRTPLGSEAAQLKGEHTALIEVRGVIAADEDASADHLVTALRNAFDNKQVKGIVLRINSPGGSPVQSGYVYDEIKRLRGLHPDTKVYAVIADIGASGAYYIAAAADEIYADKASLVGSIGVTASGFGLTEAMEKLGIERRLYTSGDHKAFLDPFSPENPDEVAFWQKVLDTTHQQFISKVKEGRGDRLKTEPNMFSGLIWSGEQALDKGLIDGLGSASYVARDVIGAENLVDYSFEESSLDRLAKQLGASAGAAISTRLLESGLQLQ